jgi:endonuclease-3 related protein
MAMLDEEFAGSLEVLAAQPTAALRQRLLELPGVGPETADAILLYALHHAVTVADEYLRRIAERHRLLQPPLRKDRRGYESLVALTLQAFADEVVEGMRSSSMSFTRLPWRWAKRIAAESRGARSAR